MDSFEIIMTPDAESDLWELRDYLANKLLVPDVALKYVRLIRNEISSLSQMPYRVKLVDDEPWHSYGIRRIIVKNFYIYF